MCTNEDYPLYGMYVNSNHMLFKRLSLAIFVVKNALLTNRIAFIVYMTVFFSRLGATGNGHLFHETRQHRQSSSGL